MGVFSSGMTSLSAVKRPASPHAGDYSDCSQSSDPDQTVLREHIHDNYLGSTPAMSTAATSEGTSQFLQAVQESETVPGLLCATDVVSASEAVELWKRIYASEWPSALARRVQHYGWRYDYQKRTISEDQYLGELPAWTHSLLARLDALGFCPLGGFDQMIINEYLPGQGIRAHIDQPDVFDDSIVSVSLGSPVHMTFAHTVSGAFSHVWLAPRSAILLRGSARYEWTHSIAARRTEMTPTGRVQRGTRVSLTFRKVKVATKHQ